MCLMVHSRGFNYRHETLEKIRCTVKKGFKKVSIKTKMFTV